MRKILITGGSGFIGTHLISSLLSQYDSISILNIDLIVSSINDRRLKTILKDIRRTDLIDQIENDKFDQCIHLAALCKEPGYQWEEYFDTNHIGTINVINLCLKLQISNIIFTSTMMVYKAGDIQRTEDSITAPDTGYGISKLLSEKELEKWQKSNGKRSLKIIRPAVVFGENENANFTRLYKSLKKGFFPFVGKSNTVKSNIYVHELVNFISFLMSRTNHGSTNYNFAFPEPSDIKTIVSTFKKVFGLKSFTPVLPLYMLMLIARAFEIIDYLGVKNPIHHRRIEKLYNSTNIFPKAALDEGYKFRFDLKSSLEDWKSSSDPNL